VQKGSSNVPALDVLLYRLARGTGSRASRHLLLTTRGRKTGKQRTVRVGFVREGDTYLLVGSNAGQANMPGWYLNLTANPTVDVQVGTRHFQAKADILTGEERARLWEKFIDERPDFAAMQLKVSRLFPLVRLTPVGR
jgi:deazaflavin-dependent oxidoreductase (nitroreductase family)